MSTAALRALARRIRTATALRLFMALPDILDWKEWRMLNQADLGEELGIAQSHISTALRELLAVGVIERQGKGPRQEWRLSLDIGWRGNVAAFQAEAIKQGRTDLIKGRKAEGPMSQKEYAGTPKNPPRTGTPDKRQHKKSEQVEQRPLNLLRPIPGGTAG